jgi:hypothetical protein
MYVYMNGGTEIIQDWHLNTVFITSVHPLQTETAL